MRCSTWPARGGGRGPGGDGRRRTRRPRLRRWSLSPAAAVVLVVAAGVTTGATAVGSGGVDAAAGRALHRYHDGVFAQAAPQFCDATAVYTASNRVRTRIVRHSDGWSNTVSSRYRKWVHCQARQMTSTMWCTTRTVDGVSGICISVRPRADGRSPCRPRRLDVRSVYYPATGRLAITCVNQAHRAAGARTSATTARRVTRTDPRGDASPARLDMLRARAGVGRRVEVETRFSAVRAGTGYLTFLDPGRRGGGVFRLQVQARRDPRTTGRLLWHAPGTSAGRFVAVRCSRLRTSVDRDAGTLRISAPRGCLGRHAPLGRGVRMTLNSFAPPAGPAAGDLLPDAPSSGFWVPRS